MITRAPNSANSSFWFTVISGQFSQTCPFFVHAKILTKPEWKAPLLIKFSFNVCGSCLISNAMIYLSDSAVRELKRLQAKSHSQDARFRIGIEPSNCSDWFYTMGFDPTIHPDDQVWGCNGIQVIIGESILRYINGLTIDYTEDLMGGGFRFHNPNAVKTCGCGTSFTVKE